MTDKPVHKITNSAGFNAFMRALYPLFAFFALLARILRRLHKLLFSKYELMRINRNSAFSGNSLNSFLAPTVRIEIHPTSTLRIGKNVSIDEHCIIKVFAGGELVIGENTYIGPNTHIYAQNKITIDHDCIMAPECFIIDHDHVLSANTGLSFDHTPRQSAHEVHIGSNVWIGTKAIITKGVSVGEKSIIGAGAVVTKSVDTGAIAVGNPFRVLEKPPTS